MTKYFLPLFAFVTFVFSFSLYASSEKVNELVNDLAQSASDLNASVANDLGYNDMDEDVLNSNIENSDFISLLDRDRRSFRRGGDRHFRGDRNFRIGRGGDRHFRGDRNFRMYRPFPGRYYPDYRYGYGYRHYRPYRPYYPRYCTFRSNPACYCYYHPYRLVCLAYRYIGYPIYSTNEAANDNSIPAIVDATNVFAMEAKLLAKIADHKKMLDNQTQDQQTQSQSVSKQTKLEQEKQQNQKDMKQGLESLKNQVSEIKEMAEKMEMDNKTLKLQPQQTQKQQAVDQTNKEDVSMPAEDHNNKNLSEQSKQNLQKIDKTMNYLEQEIK
ncbi:MAG: hypothetical protein HQK51_01355 [Oligoflexia bacterium]|nr:hypothetical protein [Oligoflexia bacterium]